MTHFTVIVKRSAKPLKKEEITGILSRRAEKLAEDMGIVFESSYYVHGEYDWIFMFYAKDIKQAKKFSNLLFAWHPGGIEKIAIMQTMIFVRKHYVLNPEKNKLKELL